MLYLRLMNAKIVGVIATIILLLAAGGIYLNQNKSATKTSQPPTSTKAENNSSSLLDLLNLGKSQRCTFKTATTNSVTEGTVYIAAGKMREDFKTTVAGKIQEMSMIRNGDTNYLWGPSLPTGIKMTLSLDKISKDPQAGQYVNPSAKIAYNCMPWNTDASLFTPPANVKFTDMSSMMTKPTGTQQKTSSPCDQITDAGAKASCLKALQGNSY